MCFVSLTTTEKTLEFACVKKGGGINLKWLKMM